MAAAVPSLERRPRMDRDGNRFRRRLPYADSLGLLARTGLAAGSAPVALYAAAALDLVLGVATVSRWRRPGLWLLQIAVILAYTLIITSGCRNSGCTRTARPQESADARRMVILYRLERR